MKSRDASENKLLPNSEGILGKNVLPKAKLARLPEHKEKINIPLNIAKGCGMTKILFKIKYCWFICLFKKNLYK